MDGSEDERIWKDSERRMVGTKEEMRRKKRKGIEGKGQKKKKK
jgi:hypothetical protein